MTCDIFLEIWFLVFLGNFLVFACAFFRSIFGLIDLLCLDSLTYFCDFLWTFGFSVCLDDFLDNYRFEPLLVFLMFNNIFFVIACTYTVTNESFMHCVINHNLY